MTNPTVLTSRHVQKHDIEANWIKAGNAEKPFIPKQAEFIVYDADENYGYERYKIGDGVHNVNELPFIADYEKTIESLEDRISLLENQIDISAVDSDTIDYILSGTFKPEEESDEQAITFDIIDQILNQIY